MVSVYWLNETYCFLVIANNCKLVKTKYFKTKIKLNESKASYISLFDSITITVTGILVETWLLSLFPQDIFGSNPYIHRPINVCCLLS